MDLSPGKYDPNFNVVRKGVPSISLGPRTTKNVGSMKNYMESFIRTILPGSEQSEQNVSLVKVEFGLGRGTGSKAFYCESDC